MKTFEEMLAKRKLSANRLPRRNNMTLDGNECPARQTSPRNKITKVIELDENEHRVERTNSFQNFIETCKNAQKKRVRFEDLIKKQPPSPRAGSDLLLFTQMRNSKQNQHHNSVDIPLEKMEFRLGNTTKQRTNTLTSAEILETGNIDFKLLQNQQIEKFANEVETDSENFLKESVRSLTKEQEKQIRQEVNIFKEKAYLKLKTQAQSLNNLQALVKNIKAEINNEVDKLIDKALVKRKDLYSLARQQVRSYFEKVDSKKKSPATHKTSQNTPCFDDKNATYSAHHKQTHQRCSVRAFDSTSDNNNSMSSAKQKLDLLIMETRRTGDTKTNLKTQEKENQSSGGREESSRFTFTVDSRRKSSKTTKRIKDRIISGKDHVLSLEEQDDVVVHQFNL